MKPIIAAFDFDGTITTKDTFLQFIIFVKGKFLFFIGFSIFLPLIILSFTGLYSKSKCKEKIFSYFFKNMEYSVFCRYCISFSDKIDTFLNNETMNFIEKHKIDGNKIYIISASVEEWLVPFVQKHGILNVIGTKIEVKNGLITGKFASKNCIGQEKVNRFLQEEPNRDFYILYAYGDSIGDKELLEFANRAWNVK